MVDQDHNVSAEAQKMYFKVSSPSNVLCVRIKSLLCFKSNIVLKGTTYMSTMYYMLYTAIYIGPRVLSTDLKNG